MGRLIRFIFSIFFIALLFLAGEIAMRMFYGDGFLSLQDPELHHTRRPYINVERSWGSGNKFRLITNSLGWRDSAPNHKIKKSTTEHKRIVFLGDSFTEGIGYNQEDTFSGITKKLLKDKGFDCDVLNGGTASYSPLLEYMRLKRFINEGYKLDFVVLLPDLSDIQDEVLYGSKYIFDNNDEPLGFNDLYYRVPFLCSLLNNSCLVRSFAQTAKVLYDSKIKKYLKNPARVRSFVGAREVLAPPQDDIGEKTGETPQEDILAVSTFLGTDLAFKSKIRGNWEAHEPSILGWAGSGMASFENNIKRIKKLCDENKIKLIIAIYPWPQQLYQEENPLYYSVLKEYFHEIYAAREDFYNKSPSNRGSLYEASVTMLCKEEGIDLINLYPEFTEIKEWHKLYVPNDIHLNKFGHEITANPIAANLIKRMQ